MYPQVAMPQRRTNKSATTALILGIAGVVLGWCLMFIPNIIAAIYGHMALKEIRRTGEAGRGRAVAGLWMAYTPIFFFVVGVVLMLVQK